MEFRHELSYLPAPVPATETALWVFVLLALLGGFILNLTPCVLPVLSLKILSVIKHGGSEYPLIRRSFITTAAGVIFSFWVLATLTIGMKMGGKAVGWGIQFQQPVFLVFIALLLTLFAANLWGFFEIGLPRFLADRLDAHRHPKIAGDFFTGAFATLLATPCTAPFLGTAVGFALTKGPREITVIFTALGLGMALPYLAVAAWPKIATLMPKPGAWMLVLKKILGCMLALTALWVVYILASGIAPAGAMAVGACLLGVLAALKARASRASSTLYRVTLSAFIALAFVIAINTHAPAISPSHDAASPWQDFDEAALEDYVRQGKAVFVDITADWCVNCKANKQFTLAREDIKDCLFSNPNVVAMQADWTNPNPKIAAFLKKHGRYGIPFNAVFGPAEPQGVILPELLTPGIVKDGFGKAAIKPHTC